MPERTDRDHLDATAESNRRTFIQKLRFFDFAGNTIILSITLLFAIFACLFGYLAFEQTRDPQQIELLERLFADADDERLMQVQASIQNTEEQIGLYLSLIQSGTAILGFAGVLLTVFGVTSLGKVNDLRQELRKELNEVQTLTDQLSRDVEQFDQIDQKIQAVSQLQFAIEQVDLGNVTTALAILQDIHALMPDDPVVNYFLGDALLRQGKFDEGATYLEKAQRKENFWAAKASYAYARRVQADRKKISGSREQVYQQVDALFNDLYDRAPLLLDVQRESAFGAWASLKRRLGDMQAAAEIYAHCASVTPYSSYPLINLGLLHLMPESSQDSNFEPDLGTGLTYFREAFEKAERKLVLNPTDHWPIFDIILSLTVLEEPIDEIRPYWQQVRDLRVIPADAQKLFDSLEQLREIDQISDHAEAVISFIEAN